MNEYWKQFIQKGWNEMDRQKDEKRGVKAMGGFGVFGIALAIVGVLVAIWGATLFPASPTDPNFMSFVMGGTVLLAVGLCLVASLPPLVRVAGVWLAAIAGGIYLWSLSSLDPVVGPIGLVPLVALTVWLTTRLWN